MVFPLPTAFLERLKNELSEADYTLFLDALNVPAPVSIRLNPRKPSRYAAHTDLVQWCETGRYLAERPQFTLDPLLHAGAYYVQEAGSMLLHTALRQWVTPSENPLRVLDLCASPGGKSTLLAGALPDTTFLMSNEVIQSRVGALQQNLQRWGYENTVISNHDPRDLFKLAGFFDIILVDAPCSGEGLFRKQPESTDEWSESNLTICELRQKRILTEIIPLLKMDGLLIYSTCTYNTKENDENIAFLLTEYDATALSLDIPADDWGIVPTRYGQQCSIHKTRSEGFYLAGVRLNAPAFEKDFTHFLPKKPTQSKYFTPVAKKDLAALEPFIEDITAFDWQIRQDNTVWGWHKSLRYEFNTVEQLVPRKYLGIEVGELLRGTFTPSHPLALSHIVSAALPRVALSLEQAILYLRKETFPLPDSTEKGWALMTYDDLPLGFAKLLGNRWNNYFPKDWRIRMR